MTNFSKWINHKKIINEKFMSPSTLTQALKNLKMEKDQEE